MSKVYFFRSTAHRINSTEPIVSHSNNNNAYRPMFSNLLFIKRTNFISALIIPIKKPVSVYFRLG